MLTLSQISYSLYTLSHVIQNEIDSYTATYYYTNFSVKIILFLQVKKLNFTEVANFLEFTGDSPRSKSKLSYSSTKFLAIDNPFSLSL